jgi:hypothetical protein
MWGPTWQGESISIICPHPPSPRRFPTLDSNAFQVHAKGFLPFHTHERHVPPKDLSILHQNKLNRLRSLHALK